ncbi:Cof-type HAD-IIB family hydrolase [Ornithinibacillus halophilus]|uniref:Cof subfamily of IIB subfamily of haloacid dehalogenase superfamily/HAD-superfamily hydrolase, subfamily IIB n=1 Tax=Ornithinibacillus halophilus TaxID=930117 RepID=A0A1M5GDE9_9BACI|nr:Cof-type HAD-IIB family hydrolase [Ornithinibacillus halophilus]SHG01709.1 hypothetical protein SAMN05216225_101260 [Ornithinibacillus halophilus]
MKLIASDLDGTLLNKNTEVSEENAMKIKEALEQGIKFVAVTGRPYESASTLLKEVGVTCPIICLNGANTYTAEGDLIRSAALDPEMIQTVRQRSMKDNIHLVYFTETGVFSTEKERFIKELADTFLESMPNISKEKAILGAEQFMIKEHVQFIDNIEEILQQTIYKLLTYSGNKDKLSNLYNELKNEQNLAISSSSGSNLEFNHINAEKGIALKHFAEQLGIDMADVMAIGDNLNDVSMLRLVGRPVAMGNAIDAVKAICEYTTKTNDENGVAEAIGKMLNDTKVRNG